ncbi:MAG: hypothetical protein IKU29_04130 [Parabacteroides sp.]|nr:hypothetical protein [Parabacteroides sp.]
MNQKLTEINKNNIPDDVKAEAEHHALMYGDSYVFVDKLKDLIEKYGLEAYHRYLIDGTMPEEENK